MSILRRWARVGRGWLQGVRNRGAHLLCRAAAASLHHVPDETAAAIFRCRGFHLLRPHYYLPIPDEADLQGGYAERTSELVGLDLNERACLERMEQEFPPYLEEFRAAFPVRGDAGTPGFYLINGAFMAIDAQVYYAFVRRYRPQRVVEVGAGWSTRVAAAALARNRAEGAPPSRLVAIDPFPPAFLREPAAGVDELIERKVQDVDLARFTELQAGDILFIDSSHVLRSGNDVEREYCEILPRLAPGVLVHVHDISLPKPYPRTYFDQRLYWNEQYLLQAFLAFNSRFEVLWPGNYLLLKHPAAVGARFPELQAMRETYPMSEPTSFWIRVRPDGGSRP